MTWNKSWELSFNNMRVQDNHVDLGASWIHRRWWECFDGTTLRRNSGISEEDEKFSVPIRNETLVAGAPSRTEMINVLRGARPLLDVFPWSYRAAHTVLPKSKVRNAQSTQSSFDLWNKFSFSVYNYTCPLILQRAKFKIMFVYNVTFPILAITYNPADIERSRWRKLRNNWRL